MVEPKYNGMIVRDIMTPKVSETFYDETTADLYVEDVGRDMKKIKAAIWVTPAIDQSQLVQMVHAGLKLAEELGAPCAGPKPVKQARDIQNG